MSRKTDIVILAAGASSRMGQPKQLLRWKETSLVGNAIAMSLNSTARRAILVLGAEAERVKTEIRETKLKIVVNPNWSSGMGSSIAYGLRSLLEEEVDCEGVLFMLCDQPLVDSSYLNKLMDEFDASRAGIVATNYGGHPGVPAVFDKRFFPHLLELNSDKGAKEILIKNQADCILLDPEGKTPDIDTLEDYLSLSKDTFK